MEIDWQNIEIDYSQQEYPMIKLSATPSMSVASNLTQSFYNNESNYSNNSVSIGSNDTTLSATENEFMLIENTDDLIIEDTDDLIVEDTDDLIVEEFFSDDEDNDNGSDFTCKSCSLSLPSKAYLKRHYNTKKHQRAVAMEMRGRKVNQKKRYVRKCERQEAKNIVYTPRREVKQVEKTSVTDLTEDEKELLTIFEEQIQNTTFESSAKEFYENFDFNLDFVDENLDGVDVKSQNEILEDLLASSENFMNEQMDIDDLIEDESELLESLPQIPAVKAPKIQIHSIEYNFSPIQEKFPQNQLKLTQMLKPAPKGDYALPQISNEQPKLPQNQLKLTQMLQKAPKVIEKRENFRNQLEITQKSHQQVKKPKVKMTIVPANYSHHCQACNKYFSKQCHFTQHINIVHSGDRNYRCEKCGKRYTTVEELNQHMLKHSENKPFKCGKCVKSYNNKIDLKRHLKMHEAIRQFNCEQCSRGFVRYDHLLKHYNVHEKKKILGNF